jgi:hypothetical protein
MSAFLISILISAAVQLLKFGITSVYEARKFRRPNLRDKEGTRVWLENLIRWGLYLQTMFFSDLATPAFTLRILLELVRPGEKWDALYAALLHDFNVTVEFVPPRTPDTAGLRRERERLVRLLCLRLRDPGRMNVAPCDGQSPEAGDLERAMAEEYLGLMRRLLDHPTVLSQSQKTYQMMTASRHPHP